MTNHYKLSTQCKNIETQKKAALLGYACMIMFMCKRSSKFQMRTLDFWIRPAIDHQQMSFFFDGTGKPVGYAIWAHLAPDAEQRLLRDSGFLLHPSEWNEGDRTWIIDCCFPSVGIWQCTTQLKTLLTESGIREIFWTRKTTQKIIIKSKHLRPSSKNHTTPRQAQHAVDYSSP